MIKNYISDLFEERITYQLTMSVPDIERMYECGDILANAKGLTHKAVGRLFFDKTITPTSFSTKQSMRRSWLVSRVLTTVRGSALNLSRDSLDIFPVSWTRVLTRCLIFARTPMLISENRWVVINAVSRETRGNLLHH